MRFTWVRKRCCKRLGSLGCLCSLCNLGCINRQQKLACFSGLDGFLVYKWTRWDNWVVWVFQWIGGWGLPFHLTRGLNVSLDWLVCVFHWMSAFRGFNGLDGLSCKWTGCCLVFQWIPWYDCFSKLYDCGYFSGLAGLLSGMHGLGWFSVFCGLGCSSGFASSPAKVSSYLPFDKPFALRPSKFIISAD